MVAGHNPVTTLITRVYAHLGLDSTLYRNQLMMYENYSGLWEFPHLFPDRLFHSPVLPHVCFLLPIILMPPRLLSPFDWLTVCQPCQTSFSPKLPSAQEPSLLSVTSWLMFVPPAHSFSKSHRFPLFLVSYSWVALTSDFSLSLSSSICQILLVFLLPACTDKGLICLRSYEDEAFATCHPVHWQALSSIICDNEHKVKSRKPWSPSLTLPQ